MRNGARWRPRSSRWRARSQCARGCSEAFERAELSRSSRVPGRDDVRGRGRRPDRSRDRRADRRARARHAPALLQARSIRPMPGSCSSRPATGSCRRSRRRSRPRPGSPSSSSGVTPTVDRTVVDIGLDGVSLQAPDGSTERLPARTVIWAAGVRASDLASKLGELAHAEVDKAGRVKVGRDLTLAGHPEVIALGDMASVSDGAGGALALPGLAPVAIQQGAYTARLIRHRLARQAGAAVQVHQQGQPGDDRSRPCRRRAGTDQAEWIAGMDDLAVRAHLVPDRLPEPHRGDHPLGDQLLQQRTRAGLADHHSGGRLRPRRDGSRTSS